MKKTLLLIVLVLTSFTLLIAQSSFDGWQWDKVELSNKSMGAVISATGEYHKEDKTDEVDYHYYVGGEIAFQLRDDNTQAELFYRLRGDGSSRTGAFVHLNIPRMMGLKWSNPNRSISLLFGAGLIWDDLIDGTDYPIETRVVAMYDNFVLTLRGGRNLVESYYYGSVSERSISIGYKFRFNK